MPVAYCIHYVVARLLERLGSLGFFLGIMKNHQCFCFSLKQVRDTNTPLFKNVILLVVLGKVSLYNVLPMLTFFFFLNLSITMWYIFKSSNHT